MSGATRTGDLGSSQVGDDTLPKTSFPETAGSPKPPSLPAVEAPAIANGFVPESPTKRQERQHAPRSDQANDGVSEKRWISQHGADTTSNTLSINTNTTSNTLVDVVAAPRPRTPNTSRTSVVASPVASRAWQELRALHADVLQKRVNKTQEAEILRRHRASVRGQEADFLEQLERRLGDDLGPSAIWLRAQLASLNQQRQEQQSLEESCEKLEDEIINDEWKMSRLENHFYVEADEDVAGLRAFESGLHYRQPGENDADDDTASDFTVSRIRTNSSPSAQRYLSLLGDRDMIREALGDLRTERAQLEAERTTRASYGISLDAESLETLGDFDKNHGQLMVQLDAVEAEMEVLQRQLSEAEVIPQNPPAVPFSEDWSLPSPDASDLDQPLSTSESAMFRSLTLNRPYYDNSEEESNMSKFINDWLLHNLSLVDREKRQYLIELHKVLSIPQTDDLGRQILGTWYDDDIADSFVQAQKNGSWSQRRSVKATVNETQRNTAQSDSPITRRHRNLPLLQITADTRAASIIARAREERASSGNTVI